MREFEESKIKLDLSTTYKLVLDLQASMNQQHQAMIDSKAEEYEK